MEAIIYIAHGSRRSASNNEFISLVNKVIEKSTAPIQVYSFIEHAGPSPVEAIETCIQKGAKRITVVPVLLLPGVHSNEDLPEVIREAEERYPDIQFHYVETIGTDGEMVTILSERLRAKGFSKQEGDAVLLVGHGSRIPEANRELGMLAEGLSRNIEFAVHTANIKNPPFYHERVEELVAQYKRVYILPFFLFTGGFTVRMEKMVWNARDQIVFCDPIGFDEQLIPIIQRRAIT